MPLSSILATSTRPSSVCSNETRADWQLGHLIDKKIVAPHTKVAVSTGPNVRLCGLTKLQASVRLDSCFSELSCSLANVSLLFTMGISILWIMTTQGTADFLGDNLISYSHFNIWLRRRCRDICDFHVRELKTTARYLKLCKLWL